MTMYNSLNIYAGNQGLGKTYSMMKDIIKITTTGFYQEIIHISDTPDQTVETFKPVLQELSPGIVMKHIPIAEAEKAIKFIIQNKRIEDHIVVILDDTLQSPSLRSGSYFNDLFTKYRLIQMSFSLGISTGDR